MVHISRFSDFRKTNNSFFREHDRIIKKYNIDFISLKGAKIPLICLYEIVFILFENNSLNLRISNVILLTLSVIGLLSKENDEQVNKLLQACKDKKIFELIPLVKNTIKSIKNLTNIVLKNDGVVIQNIEQSLKYRYSVDVLSLIKEYIWDNKIIINDFCYWYIVDQRDKQSRNMIDSIKNNYYD